MDDKSAEVLWLLLKKLSDLELQFFIGVTKPGTAWDGLITFFFQKALNQKIFCSWSDNLSFIYSYFSLFLLLSLFFWIRYKALFRLSAISNPILSKFKIPKTRVPGGNPSIFHKQTVAFSPVRTLIEPTTVIDSGPRGRALNHWATAIDLTLIFLVIFCPYSW